MTNANRIAWDDNVLPFQLDHCDIRGRFGRLDAALNAVLAQHDYPLAIEALVAEAVLLTALIGPMIDLKWKLSLQVRGNGPARLVATDYYAPGKKGDPARIRAYASFDEGRLAPQDAAFAQIGQGYFAVLIDQGEGTTPYSGLTPIAGRSLADCAQHYFAQSEQIPTRFGLSFGRSSRPGEAERWRAGGIMLQHMPKASPFVAGEGGAPEGGLARDADPGDGDSAENWTRANMLLETAEAFELIGPDVQPPDLLYRLFHQEAPRVYDSHPVVFGCTCSQAKVRQTLSIYSDRDIGHMTTDQGIVTADCQFCGAHYEFDPATLGFEAAERANDRG